MIYTFPFIKNILYVALFCWLLEQSFDSCNRLQTCILFSNSFLFSGFEDDCRRESKYWRPHQCGQFQLKGKYIFCRGALNQNTKSKFKKKSFCFQKWYCDFFYESVIRIDQFNSLVNSKFIILNRAIFMSVTTTRNFRCRFSMWPTFRMCAMKFYLILSVPNFL